MHKIISLLLVFFFAICVFSGCSNISSSDDIPANHAQFSSNEEMLKYLEGIWATDGEEKTYYIFQDNKIYVTTDAMYSAEVETMLDYAKTNGGLQSLLHQTFEKVTERISLKNFSLVPNQITLQPENGMLKFSSEQIEETRILITDSSVSISTAESNSLITKISDTVDFSTEHFQTLFCEVQENIQVSTSYFWTDPLEYGELVKSTIPSFDWWIPEETAEGTIYTPPKEFPLSAALAIAKTNLVFHYEVIVSSYNEDFVPTKEIIYTPSINAFRILDKDNYSLDILSLIEHGVYVTKDFPGAYTDPLTLYNVLLTSGTKTSYGFMGIHMVEATTLTKNGLTYTLTTLTNGTFGQFDIKAAGTISLASILATTEEPEPTEPTLSPAPGEDITDLCDGTKSWVAKWKYMDVEYSIHFVFDNDGTCYYALSNYELYDAGMGTYTIENDTTLSVNMKVSGGSHSATYTFDPSNFSLTVVSDKGIVESRGDVLILREDPDNDAEKIKDFGKSYVNGY